MLNVHRILFSLLFVPLLSAGNKDEKIAPSEDDYERAEKAILTAISTVEDKVQRLVAAEVDTLFHEKDHNHKKAEFAAKAKKAVEQGAGKVKRAVNEHAETHVYPFEKDHPYPYVPPQNNKKGQAVEHHKDHRILDAVEAAEKAVLHAIQQEVNTLFHEVDHKETDKAKTTVTLGIQKAAAKVDAIHEHRRGWLTNQTNALIEEYSSHPEYFLE